MADPGAVLPLLAGLLGASFGGAVLRQYARRRRPHQLAWGLGLSAYALVSLMEAAVAAWGWTILLYRVYFPLAALNVGLLGLGTIQLLGAPRAARGFLVLVAVGGLLAAVAPLAIPLGPGTPVAGEEDGAPVVKPLAEWGTSLGAKPIPFSNPGRMAFLALNVLGGLALVGGALASWWRTRAAGVLLIGLGALLPFLGGVLSTLLGLEDRVALQFLGVAIMFAGYLRGRETAPVPSPAPAQG